MSSTCISLVIQLIKDGQKHKLYDLHQRFRLTPVEAQEAVEFLARIEILNYDGKFLSLKSNIKAKHLASLYQSIQGRKLSLDEKEISNYRADAIEPNSLYSPDLSRLDKGLLLD